MSYLGVEMTPELASMLVTSALADVANEMYVRVMDATDRAFDNADVDGYLRLYEQHWTYASHAQTMGLLYAMCQRSVYRQESRK